MTSDEKKSHIINRLREQKLRITCQRRLLIGIILDKECGSCKEIYYTAQKKDPSIGLATVYRMMKTMEECGLLERRSLYRIAFEPFTA